MEGTGLLGVNDMPLCLPKSNLPSNDCPSVHPLLLTVQVGVVSELWYSISIPTQTKKEVHSPCFGRTNRSS
jgi:hypothetical protein